MSGRHSRDKGAKAEREVADMAVECGFVKARRFAPMQCADGNAGADVDRVGRLWLEVKRRGSGSLYGLACSVLFERPGWIPAMAYREDGRPWLGVVPLRELLKLERDAGQLLATRAALSACVVALGALGVRLDSRALAALHRGSEALRGSPGGSPGPRSPGSDHG